MLDALLLTSCTLTPPNPNPRTHKPGPPQRGIYVTRSASKIVGRFPSARAAALAFDFTTISRHYAAARSAEFALPNTEVPPKSDAGDDVTAGGGGGARMRRRPRVNFAGTRFSRVTLCSDDVNTQILTRNLAQAHQ